MLREHLAQLSHRRHRRGLVHPLEGVLSLTVLGLLCGCPSLSAIHRFGDIQPELLSQLGLRRSPWVQTRSRLLGMVSVGEVRRGLLEFVLALEQGRGHEITTAALDGKTLRGVREDGAQLKELCVFSGAGLAALDQLAVGNHFEEPQAAQEWIEAVASHCPGLEMLTGDALYADTDLAQAIVDRGMDYSFKLKKTNPNSTTT